ncbi:MAG TPA: hypothetical protein VNK24_00435 [Elusimicrobiota bacterium]|nr:hypothetical protein [Elusimicrobiota bacterium]
MAKYPDYDDVLIHPGRYLTAEWFYTIESKMPAREYYAGLAEMDQDRFDDMIQYLCETKPGSLLPKTLYRIEDRPNKIYALKPRDERFFNFTTAGAKVIITNAYHKHSQQMTKADLEHLKVAVRYRHDYLKRVQEGTYYEN